MNAKLREQWRDYDKLVSTKTIESALARPQRLIQEEIEVIFPNIELGADAPVVRSIIFLSHSYLGEARLAEGKEEFDMLLRTQISNYRISIGQHEIIRNAAAIEQARSKGQEAPSPDKMVYQTATVSLFHSVGGLPFATKINYFGNKCDEWLQRITDSIPVAMLKPTT